MDHTGCPHAAGALRDSMMFSAGHEGHTMAGHDMPGHDMPGHDMPEMCSMNMIFNWQIKNTCVVFEWWHIHTPLGMLLSCLAIFAIGAGYEYIRAWASELDRGVALADIKRQEDQVGGIGAPSGSESDALLNQQRDFTNVRKKQQVLQSIVYAGLMAISFWLMLVFMTYNGYLMIATIAGAGFGHYFFSQGRLTASRSISCH